MTDLFMKMNLLQMAALAGAAVLLAPVVWDLLKSGASAVRKVKLPAIRPKKQEGHNIPICFDHVMCVRSLLAKSGDEEALRSYDTLVVPNLVRVLSEEE